MVVSRFPCIGLRLRKARERWGQRLQIGQMQIGTLTLHFDLDFPERLAFSHPVNRGPQCPMPADLISCV